MIGQKNLQSEISTMVENDTLSRFIILTGAEGSGRKTLARFIASKIGCHLVVVETNAEAIREMIEQSYKVTDTTLYLIPDADNVSLTVKNALLKVTEEPPNNAYFVMTLKDRANTLDTITSRGVVYAMEQYTGKELESYCTSCALLDNATTRKVLELCTNIGQIEKIKDIDVKEFLDFVSLVVDNVHTTSGANALKLSSKIDLDGKGSGYDLELFWSAFINVCMSRSFGIHSGELSCGDYVRGVILTSKHQKALRTTGINKASLFDIWLLDIRREWG